MPGKQILWLAVTGLLLGSSGCCHWFESRHCPCQPACVPQTCTCQPACAVPPPPAPPATWARPNCQ